MLNNKMGVLCSLAALLLHMALGMCTITSAFCPARPTLAGIARKNGTPLLYDHGRSRSNGVPRRRVSGAKVGSRVALLKQDSGVEKDFDWWKYPPLFLAGGLCAAITHGVTVPLDLVKTSQQVNRHFCRL